MSIRHWLALLLGILAAAVCLYLPFVPQTILPFGTKPLDRQHYVIEASSYTPGLPAGLLPGDVVDTARMDVTSRLGLMTYALVPAGTRITLPIDRQGRELRVTVAFVRTPLTMLNLFDVVFGIAQIWLVAALGLLIVWRGNRLAAAGVGIWCLAKLSWEVPISTPLPLPLAGWVDVVGMALYYSGALLGAYLLAEDLAWEQAHSRARRWIRACFVLVLVGYLVTFVGNDLAFHLGGRWWFDPVHLNVRLIAHLLAFGIPIGMLLSRYRRVQATNRARIRWVLASVACVMAAYLANSDWASTVLSNIQVDMLYDGFNAVAFIGFTYAVLRHRLVAVEVVLNRALVSAIAIAIVLAVFGALESAIEHAALGHRASTFVALAVPLVLGIFFDQINKLIKRWVKFLFFRRQFLAEAALSRFTRECGYITSAEVLVERTLAEVLRHLGAPAAGMYESAGEGYRCLQQCGSHGYPDRLAVDDPACVRLRATLAETTLDDLDSALGSDALAFPVALRGVLVGMLVVARRQGELYTLKERELLLQLVHQVGTSLYAMYVSQTRGFVSEVANGVLPSAERTRAVARQLMQSSP